MKIAYLRCEILIVDIFILEYGCIDFTYSPTSVRASVVLRIRGTENEGMNGFFRAILYVSGFISLSVILLVMPERMILFSIGERDPTG